MNLIFIGVCEWFSGEKLFLIKSIGGGAFPPIENVLAKLDAESWEKLRTKALPYVTADDPARRYQQLFSTLDEARGFNFIAGQGYEQIEFIEPSKSKKGGTQSPDLIGRKAGSTAVLEVKTINESATILLPMPLGELKRLS